MSVLTWTTNANRRPLMSRTPDQVVTEFQKHGISIAAWAKQNGFSAPLVYKILKGERKPVRGESHRIAVCLGLKEGGLGQIDDLPFLRAEIARK